MVETKRHTLRENRVEWSGYLRGVHNDLGKERAETRRKGRKKPLGDIQAEEISRSHEKETEEHRKEDQTNQNIGLNADEDNGMCVDEITMKRKRTEIDQDIHGNMDKSTDQDNDHEQLEQQRIN